VDATSIYFTDAGNARVMRMDKQGGTAVPLATGQPGPNRIALDDAYVYWSNSGDGSSGRVKKDGSAVAQTVVTNGVEGPLAVDAAYVYWSGQNSGAYGLQRLAKDGSGSASRLGAVPITTPVVTLLVDDAAVYWGGDGDPQRAGINNLWRIDKTSGAVVGLGSGRGAMTMDAASIYVTMGSPMAMVPHQVVAIDKSTFAFTTLYTIEAGTLGGLGELAVDGTYLYRTGRGSFAANPNLSAVARIIKCGVGQRSQTIANPIALARIQTDDAFLYGINAAAIVRIRKSPAFGVF
jgi:hypothetical protein